MALGQAFVNWVLLGCLYAAIALGFSLVWGIMNIVNLAHGAFVITGAYVAFWVFTNWHIDPFIGIFVAMGVLFLVGWLIQYGAINRVIRAPMLVTFLLTFGVDLLVTDILQRLFTSDQRSINTQHAGQGVDFGTIHIPYDKVGAAIVALLLTAALAFFLLHTRTGNAILATGMDRDAARLMGINIAQIYALTFGLGAALAGAAGTLIGQFYAFDPSRGSTFTLRSFVIVVLGGLGTPWAVVAGGIVFSFAETFVPVVIPSLGAGYDNAIAFAVFVIILLIRPTGLFGRASYT